MIKQFINQNKLGGGGSEQINGRLLVYNPLEESLGDLVTINDTKIKDIEYYIDQENPDYDMLLKVHNYKYIQEGSNSVWITCTYDNGAPLEISLDGTNYTEMILGEWFEIYFRDEEKTFTEKFTIRISDPTTDANVLIAEYPEMPDMLFGGLHITYL